jgi:hypothetical protein
LLRSPAESAVRKMKLSRRLPGLTATAFGCGCLRLPLPVSAVIPTANLDLDHVAGFERMRSLER